MTRKIKHLWDEADIGSGEKSPGEKETEKLLEQVPKQGADNPKDDAVNDARAEQQMIEGNADTAEAMQRIEQKKRAPEQDDPDRRRDTGDVVSPKGNK